MILILDNIRSAHNVGALFRTADGAGVAKLYLVGITPKPADQKRLWKTPAEKSLQKTALGAEYTIPWESVADLAECIQKLKSDGYHVVALEQSTTSQNLLEYRPPVCPDKIALIVGNEVEGVSEAVLGLCDAILEIPMRGTKNSLNVSVAAGIAVYHLSSKREKW